VFIAGALTLIFLIAIVREVLQGHQVRTQVRRLREEVSAEEQRQKDLQDLLTYLQSPTFQERQARLELGLKKEGERVLIVPPSTTNTVNEDQEPGNTSVDTPTTKKAPTTNPERWLQYFFRK
jgi:cell division protein FtsB